VSAASDDGDVELEFKTQTGEQGNRKIVNQDDQAVFGASRVSSSCQAVETLSIVEKAPQGRALTLHGLQYQKKGHGMNPCPSYFKIAIFERLLSTTKAKQSYKPKSVHRMKNLRTKKGRARVSRPREGDNRETDD